jgi:ABC-type spermidine/putrescine transport system permease subunit II
LAVEEVPGVNIALCPACRHSFTLRPFVDKRKTSRKAILSLWLGIGTLLFACLTGVPAALVGAVALYEISRNEERLKGRRLAVAGIAMGIFFSFLCTPVVLVVIAAFIDTIRKG